MAQEPPAASAAPPPPDPEEQRLTEEAEKLDAAAAEDEGHSPAPANDRSNTAFAAKVLQMLVALAATCALAYLVLGKGLPWVMRLSPTARRNMAASDPRGMVEVVDRLPLDQKHTVYVLKLKRSYFLVGSGEQSMSLLSRLSEEEVQIQGDAQAPAQPAGFGKLRAVFSKNNGKEG